MDISLIHLELGVSLPLKILLLMCSVEGNISKAADITDCSEALIGSSAPSSENAEASAREIRKSMVSSRLLRKVLSSCCVKLPFSLISIICSASFVSDVSLI